jgi:hypothetical protein
MTDPETRWMVFVVVGVILMLGVLALGVGLLFE